MNRLLICLLSFLISACAPGYARYYEPTLIGFITRPYHGPGPPDTIYNKHPSGVEIKMRAIKDKNDEFINIEISVPKGVIFQFENNDFEIVSQVSGELQKYKSIKIDHYHEEASKHDYWKRFIKEPFDYSTILSGGTKESPTGHAFGSSTNYKQYRLYVEFVNMADLFLFNLPIFKINDNSEKIPPIRFEKKSGFFIYALNG